MGTELKCAADGRHGLLLFLEIQEGKDTMRRALFRNEMGGGGCGLCFAGWFGRCRSETGGGREGNIVSVEVLSQTNEQAAH